MEEEHYNLTPFRLLLHRAISFWQMEEERWEDEMLHAAIENSLASIRESPPEQKPVVLLSSVLDSGRDEECHLCLEDLKKGDLVADLPCHHCFHSACMEELVRHQHMLCPLCREPITNEEKTGSA